MGKTLENEYAFGVRTVIGIIIVILIFATIAVVF